MRYKTIRSFSLFAILISLSSSCSGLRPTHTTGNFHPQLWIRTSPEYAALTELVYRTAYDRLESRLKSSCPQKPAAVIMDVDETVLDNMAYEYWRERQRKSWDSKEWDEYVRRVPTEAGAVPGAADFIRKIHELHPNGYPGHGEMSCRTDPIAVIYISDRSTEVINSTRLSFDTLGITIADADRWLFKPDGSSNKETRRQEAANSYEILAYFGDQLADFDHTIAVGVEPPEERYRHFCENREQLGKTWFVLPNPSYGDWVRALSDKDPGSYLSGTRNPHFICPAVK